MVLAKVALAVGLAPGVLAPRGASALGSAPLTLAPALSSPTSLLAPAAALAAPAAALVAPSASLDFVERRGLDGHGREVILVDALDPAAPERGTVGHVDVSQRDGQASLDGPLDFWVDAAARPAGAHEAADLTHFREHLWFGLAVLPAYRGGGLGARLMDQAVSRLRAAGVRDLFIRATETSLGFYQKRFGARVRSVERETGDEGEITYRLEIDLSGL
jgi:GNAT superfamily N-acetyltransferase